MKIASAIDNNGKKDVKVMAPLKYPSNFWRIAEIPLINLKPNLF